MRNSHPLVRQTEADDNNNFSMGMISTPEIAKAYTDYQ